MLKMTVVGGLLAALSLMTAAVLHAQTPDAAKRFPQVTIDELNGQPRALAEEILKVSSIGLAGPYNPMLRSPVMADRLFRLLDYLRFNTSVPRRLNEFAILIQARLWTSQVEWYAHQPLAIKAGLSEAVAADLKAGRRPAVDASRRSGGLRPVHGALDESRRQRRDVRPRPSRPDRSADRRSHRGQRHLRDGRDAAERGAGTGARRADRHRTAAIVGLCPSENPISLAGPPRLAGSRCTRREAETAVARSRTDR